MVLNVHQIHSRKAFEDAQAVIKDVYDKSEIIVWSAVIVFICVAIIMSIMIWKIKITD